MPSYRCLADHWQKVTGLGYLTKRDVSSPPVGLPLCYLRHAICHVIYSSL